ncbi:MAG: MAPEG family protein [Burkholderiales bacterium]|nr:MAPEG family protein [Burkholderiales bacterium]
MGAKTIFLPMATLALWTLTVLLLIPIARFKAGAQGHVNAGDFRYGESDRVPAHVRLPNRNFMNLLEVPVLFYLACVVAFLMQTVDATLLTLAWVYVALRVGHSCVHLSYNNVMHRLTLFAISNVVAVTMWGLLSWRLLN